MEILPAVLSGRFIDFASGITAYGKLAGKPFERASSRLPYAGATARLFEWLDLQGVQGFAQSSWGPAVVAVCESHVEADALVSAAEAAGIAEQHEIRIAAFDNRGAIIREIDDASVSP